MKPIITKSLILAIIIGSILLYLVTPYVRNYDYAQMPVSNMTYQEGVVVIQGNIKDNHIEQIPLIFDSNINCIPKSGYKNSV